MHGSYWFLTSTGRAIRARSGRPNDGVKDVLEGSGKRIGVGLLQYSFCQDWGIPDYRGNFVPEGRTVRPDMAVGETYYGTGESVAKATDEGGPYAQYSHEVGGFVRARTGVGNTTYHGIMAGSLLEKDGPVDLDVPERGNGDAALSCDFAALERDMTFSLA